MSYKVSIYFHRTLIPDYVRRFATEEALLEKDAITGLGASKTPSDSESSMSEFSDDEAHDMEL